MTSKPRKPWRVIISSTATYDESEHTSEKKAYEHLVPELRRLKGTALPNLKAKVMQWEGGRWWHFETVTADEIPDA